MQAINRVILIAFLLLSLTHVLHATPYNISEHGFESAIDSDNRDVGDNVSEIDGLYATKSYVIASPDYWVNISVDFSHVLPDPSLVSSLEVHDTFYTSAVALLGNHDLQRWNGTAWQTICADDGIILPTTDTPYSCDILSVSNLSGAESYRARVTAGAATGSINFNQVAFYLVVNGNLTIENATLISSSATNYTTGNLTASANVVDTLGNGVVNVTNWYVNGNSLLLLNMPFLAPSNDTFTRDYTEFGNNATNGTSPGPVWTRGDFDGNGLYNFSTNYLYIPPSSSLDLSTKNYSISLWFKTDQNAVALIGAANLDTLMLGVNGNHIIYYGGNGGWYFSQTGSALATDNLWHNVVLTWDGTTYREYLNGVLDSSYVSLHISNPGGIDIGAYGSNTWSAGGWPFSGEITKVQIYNRTLSQGEINFLSDNPGIYQTIPSSELVDGDVWQACLTPNNGVIDGDILCTNNVTVSTPPIVPINSCQNIIIPGEYDLNESFVATSSPCITISADDANLNGNGFNITGIDGTAPLHIIDVTGWHDSVYNMVFLPGTNTGGENDGIYSAQLFISNTSEFGSYYNLTAYGNTQNGTNFGGSGIINYGFSNTFFSNILQGGTALDALGGFGFINSGTNMTIYNSRIIGGDSSGGTQAGVGLENLAGSGNIIYNNEIKTGSSSVENYDLLDESFGNTYYNNNFNGSNGLFVTGEDIWNTTLDCGHRNIIGGQCTGGNFYRAYTGSSISGGIGSTPYAVPTFGTLDYLPLTTNVTNCPILNESGVYFQPGNYVGAPNSGVPYAPTACIVVDASNVDLECSSFTTTANDSSDFFGILVKPGHTNLTVNGCGYFNYQYSAYVLSDNSNFINSAFNGPGGYGSVTIAGQNTIINSSYFYNMCYGIDTSGGATNLTVMNTNFSGIAIRALHIAGENSTILNNNFLGDATALEISSNGNTIGHNAFMGDSIALNVFGDYQNIFNNDFENSSSVSLYLDNSSFTNISNNIIVNNTIGINLIDASGFTTILNNTVLNNSVYGIMLNSSGTNNQVINNTVNGGDPAILTLSAYCTINGNNVSTTGVAGISSTAQFCTIDSNNASAALIAIGLNLGGDSNNASNNLLDGNNNLCAFSYGSNNRWTDNTCYHGGISSLGNSNYFARNTVDCAGHDRGYYTASGANQIINNTATGCVEAGFFIQSFGNYLLNNSAYLNYRGFHDEGFGGTQYINNTAANNSLVGFGYVGTDGSTISNGNLAINNSIQGFGYNSENMTSIGDKAILSGITGAVADRLGIHLYNFTANDTMVGNGSGTDGIGLVISADNIYVQGMTSHNNAVLAAVLLSSNGTITDSQLHGDNPSRSISALGFPSGEILDYQASASHINNNLLYDTPVGVIAYHSTGSSTSGNTIHNASSFALATFNSNVSFTNDHLYNNTLDFYVNNTATSSLTLSHLYIDSPSGIGINSTNFSATDSVVANESYSIRWDNFPNNVSTTNRTAYNNGSINITNYSTFNINTAVWTYNPGALNTTIQNSFRIWFYQINWTQTSATVSVGGHTLTLHNLASPGDYAILYIPEGTPITAEQQVLVPAATLSLGLAAYLLYQNGRTGRGIRIFLIG